MNGPRIQVLGATALATLLVTGCSGGGSGTAPAPIAPSTPGAAAPASSGTGTAVFTFKLRKNTAAAPSATRRSPAYLSLGTMSFVIQIQDGGIYTTSVVDTNEGSVTCTDEPTSPYQTCTTSVLAPAGSDIFTVSAYDQDQSSALTTSTSLTTVPASSLVGNLLGTVVTTVSVAPATSNPINIVLDGVVSTVKLALLDPSPALGASESIPLLVLAYDADGYLIVGTYTAPVSITDSVSGGSTALVQNGTSMGASATTSQSSDVFSVSFNGGAGTAVFSGSTSGITYVSATLAPTSTTPADLVYVSAYDTPAGESGVDGLDLGSATSVGGSTSNFAIANVLSKQQLKSGYYETQFFLGPKNQFTYANGLSTEYFAAAPIAASGGAPVVEPATPLFSFTGYYQGYGSGSTQIAIPTPQGDLIQAVAEYPASAGAPNVWARYLTGIANTLIPSETTFSLQDPGDYGVFDPSGNFWQFSTTGLEEYNAATMASANNGAALIPVLTIPYGTGAGQMTAQSYPSSAYFTIGFGPAGSNEVVVNEFNYIYVFTNVTPGSSITTATEYFVPSNDASGYLGGVMFDPAGSGSIILANAYDRGLDYFHGPGAMAPVNGSAIIAYKVVSVPDRILNGNLYPAYQQ